MSIRRSAFLWSCFALLVVPACKRGSSGGGLVPVNGFSAAVDPWCAPLFMPVSVGFDWIVCGNKADTSLHLINAAEYRDFGNEVLVQDLPLDGFIAAGAATSILMDSKGPVLAAFGCVPGGQGTIHFFAAGEGELEVEPEPRVILDLFDGSVPVAAAQQSEELWWIASVSVDGAIEVHRAVDTDGDAFVDALFPFARLEELAAQSPNAIGRLEEAPFQILARQDVEYAEVGFVQEQHGLFRVVDIDLDGNADGAFFPLRESGPGISILAGDSPSSWRLLVATLPDTTLEIWSVDEDGAPFEWLAAGASNEDGEYSAELVRPLVEGERIAAFALDSGDQSSPVEVIPSAVLDVVRTSPAEIETGGVIRIYVPAYEQIGELPEVTWSYVSEETFPDEISAPCDLEYELDGVLQYRIPWPEGTPLSVVQSIDVAMPDVAEFPGHVTVQVRTLPDEEPPGDTE